MLLTTILSRILKSQFDDLWNKFNIYSAGEQLFGLAITDYPSLARIKKELNLLQKLYGLYSTVMNSINGYFDILWTEVDIDKINQELLDLQNRYVVTNLNSLYNTRYSIPIYKP